MIWSWSETSLNEYSASSNSSSDASLLVTQRSQPIATPVELLQLDLAQFDGAARLDQFDRCRVRLDFEQRLTPMDVLA